MAGISLQTGRQLHQGIGAELRVGDAQRCEAGSAHSERAGLVEEHGPEASCGLDHITAAEEDAGTGSTAGAHADRSRCGQAKGAGTSHHQHGDAQLKPEHKRCFGPHPQAAMTAMGMGGGGGGQHLGPELGAPKPPEQPGGQRQQDHGHAETAGHPIGEALNRPFARLGLLHQGDDPRHGAIAAGAQHLEHQRRLQVEAAGGQFRTGRSLQRQRFTGEAGHIQAGAPLQHAAIHGYAIARQQPQAIAGPQGTHPHRPGGGLRSLAHQQQGLIGLQPRQLLQRPAGAEAGALLQEAAEQHEAQQHHGLVEEALPAHRGPDQSHKAGDVGAAHAQTHQGVHARGTGQGRAEATHQDRPARQRQGQGGHQGVHPDIRQPGQRQLSQLRQVTGSGDHHQQQRHEQLTPALPPALLLQALRRCGALLLLPAMGGITHRRERLDQASGRIGANLRFKSRIKTHPGGAVEQAHTRLPHTGLGEQALLHRPYTAPAFHPFHLQQQGSHRLRGGIRAAAHGIAGSRASG